MTDPHTARQIVLDMEPLFRDLLNGTDAAVALARSNHFDHPGPNGLVFVADGVDALATRLKDLWEELDLATRGQSPTSSAPITLVTE